jgi:hypothetical protein
MKTNIKKIRLATTGYRLCPHLPKGRLIRSLINFLLSNKLIVIKLRYLSPLWGDASQSEAGGIHIYTGSNSLGGQATPIAVRRETPSNLFWIKIAILEVAKGRI